MNVTAWYFSNLALVLKNTSLFGYRIGLHETSEDEVIGLLAPVWLRLLSLYEMVVGAKWGTQASLCCDDTGRDWNEVPAYQGTPRIDRHVADSEKRQGEDCSHQHLDNRLWASRTRKKNCESFQLPSVWPFIRQHSQKLYNKKVHCNNITYSWKWYNVCKFYNNKFASFRSQSYQWSSFPYLQSSAAGPDGLSCQELMPQAQRCLCTADDYCLGLPWRKLCQPGLEQAEFVFISNGSPEKIKWEEMIQSSLLGAWFGSL